MAGSVSHANTCIKSNLPAGPFGSDNSSPNNHAFPIGWNHLSLATFIHLACFRIANSSVLVIAFCQRHVKNDVHSNGILLGLPVSSSMIFHLPKTVWHWTHAAVIKITNRLSAAFDFIANRYWNWFRVMLQFRRLSSFSNTHIQFKSHQDNHTIEIEPNQ